MNKILGIMSVLSLGMTVAVQASGRAAADLQRQQAREQRREQAMRDAAKRHQQRARHDAYLEGVLDKVAQKKIISLKNQSAL